MHDSEQRSSPGGVKGRRYAILAIVVACVASGLTARQLLYQTADLPDTVGPAPRKGINAPFITTPDLVVEKMVELAALEEGDLVHDLGCGDGRIVITAAIMSGCRGVGFDIDPERVAEALENVRLHEVEDRVRIVEQDIFTVDLSEADVAMMYLLPWMIEKLVPQFDRMRPGCRIVSHDFWIEGVRPDAIVEWVTVEDSQGHGIYLYTTPLKKDPAMERGRPPRLDQLPSPPSADSR